MVRLPPQLFGPVPVSPISLSLLARRHLVCITASSWLSEEDLRKTGPGATASVVGTDPSLPAVPDVHYIAVLHEVLFALKTKGSLGARSRFATGGEQAVPADGFGADEVMLKVRVNGAGGLRRPRGGP